jgi:hypothetical protein
MKSVASTSDIPVSSNQMCNGLQEVWGEIMKNKNIFTNELTSGIYESQSTVTK